MESILFIGVCSAVDTLGKILLSCTCSDKSATPGFWGGAAAIEIDNASVVPVCEKLSSPSHDSSKVHRNVQFSKMPTTGIMQKSLSLRSAATTSTCSTFSMNDNESSSEYLDIPYLLPVKIKTCCSSSREEFVEVKIAREGSQTLQRQQRRCQRAQLEDRQTRRHQFLGHTKRKRRVRQLLTEDIINRHYASKTPLTAKTKASTASTTS